MTTDPTPSNPLSAADQALLVDYLRGECSAAQGAELEARFETDAVLRAERDALQGLAEVESGRFATEMAVAATDAPRLATYVISRVRQDEAAARSRGRAEVGGRRRWARILAVSIGLHVVLLGVLTWRLQSDRSNVPDEGTHIELGEFPIRDWDPVPEDLRAEHLDRALVEMSEEQKDLLPDEFWRWDGGELDKDMEQMLQDLAQGARAAPTFLYPRGMGLALRRRGKDDLKRRRLEALGFDADGTLQRVANGLNYLRGRQLADGAFPADDGRGAVSETAMAMLAFLGDGQHSKADNGKGKVVRRGVTWLRERAFDESGLLRDSISGPDLGVLLVALSEDYMLSYGLLGLGEARVRGAEIQLLASAVSAVDEQIAADDDALWSRWALDAAERTGVVRRSVEDRARFRRWLAAATGPDVADATPSSVEVLSRGTALLYAERGSSKKRFLTWSEATGQQILDGLLPNGKAKGAGAGDRVAETALWILALQTAYRTY